MSFALAVSDVATEQSDRMTWAEMCRAYPDEWVVLTDIAWVDESAFEFSSAIVVGHFAMRRTASPKVKAAFAQYPNVFAFHTGETEERTVRLRAI
ncbi:MAG TPA: hypothetical protein VGM90_05335 [Kofleriaceae bacterium]|jgi:hypothetical protein